MVKPKGFVPGVKTTLRKGHGLRWSGHRLQEGVVALTKRYKKTMANLKSKGDCEARGVMLELMEAFNALCAELASHLAEMSMVNLGMVEILRKNKDGTAALMMRSAAELVVKGLANAEEEILALRETLKEVEGQRDSNKALVAEKTAEELQALKATLKEVEGQRDNYKTLLAKTNAEVNSGQTYAQMKKAIGHEDGKPATTSLSAEAVGNGAVPQLSAMPKRAAKKERASVRQEQQESKLGKGAAAGSSVVRTIKGGGSGSRTTSAVNSTAADGNDYQHGRNPDAGPESGKGKKGNGRALGTISKPGTADWMTYQRSRATVAKITGKGSSTATATIKSQQEASRIAAAAAPTAGAKRRRNQMEPIGVLDGEEAEELRGGGTSLAGDEGFEESGQYKKKKDKDGKKDKDRPKNDKTKDRKQEIMEEGARNRGEGLGVLGQKDRGVEVPVSHVDRDGWDVEPREAAEAGDGGGGGDEGGDDVEVQSIYDSDDAPSLFF